MEKSSVGRCHAQTVTHNVRCPYLQQLEINGKRLCVRHARIEALSLAIDSGDAEILPNAAFEHDPVHI